MAIEYTKKERAAISLAWSHLTGYHMPSGIRASLDDAVKAERNAFNERTSTTQAKGMVINWFHDGWSTPDMPAAHLTGCRIAAVLATLAGIDTKQRPLLSDDALRAIVEACRAQQAAFERSLISNRLALKA